MKSGVAHKKLEGSSTLADCGVGHLSTLLALVLPDSAATSAAAPASASFRPPREGAAIAAQDAPVKTLAESRCKRRCVCVGQVHYKASATEDLKTGEIIAVSGANGTSCTTLRFEGTEYPNALEWLAKAFNNSGRSCHVRLQPSAAADTPRAKVYLPPTAACPFGRYC